MDQLDWTTVLLTPSVMVLQLNTGRREYEIFLPPEITPCTDTLLGCCYPLEHADTLFLA